MYHKIKYVFFLYLVRTVHQMNKCVKIIIMFSQVNMVRYLETERLTYRHCIRGVQHKTEDTHNQNIDCNTI